MWWSPSISSWKQSKTTGVIGVGDLSGPEINALVALKDQLKADALRLLESQGETLAIAHSCFTAMIHSWVRFHGYPSTFDEKTLELVEFQRNWLELRGCVDYYDDTVRKMWSRLAPEGVVLERVGCLTVNPVIAQECFAAALPVWLIRDVEKFRGGGIRIDKVVEPLKPESVLQVEPWTQNAFPVLYKGSPNIPDRYIVQHRFARSRMCWKDPWGNVVVDEVADPLNMGHDVESTTRSLKDLEAFQTVGM